MERPGSTRCFRGSGAHECAGDRVVRRQCCGLLGAGATFDSTGHPDRAIGLCREALDLGLTGERRAAVQLAISRRNVGEAAEGVRLLRAEETAGPDHLDDAGSAFLAEAPLIPQPGSFVPDLLASWPHLRAHFGGCPSDSCPC
ncbi:tetratricopeptide repeat protein [Deinococcus hopiensis]|uniref:tetratricopeptide repeat protein n=1 Tax=Deinococcus hopiensis TaxID=309885 RepID=UPI001BAF8CE2